MSFMFNPIPITGIPSSSNFTGLANLQQSFKDFNNSSGSIGNGGGGGGGGIMAFFTVLVIIFKYPLKFFLIYYFFVIVFFLFKKIYLFACKAVTKILKFFKILIKPKYLKIAKMKIYDVFRLFAGFIDFFVGLIFLCISILIFIAMVVLTIPFNMVLIW